jgi:hypothetical protein
LSSTDDIWMFTAGTLLSIAVAIRNASGSTLFFTTDKVVVLGANGAGAPMPSVAKMQR